MTTSALRPGERASRSAASLGQMQVRRSDLARAWIAVGTQSIGGATSTVHLMRQRLIERTGWLTRREFMEAYSLSQLSPGIHLVALAGLIGHRLGGVSGIAVSVAGMMVPAAIITVALSAGLAGIAQHPLTQAALAGVGPVTAGMTLGLGLLSARSAVRAGGRGVVDVAVIAAAFAALVVVPASPALVIVSCGVLGALLLGRERPATEREPVTE